MRFRAVVVRAHDLAPIDHRPGTWVVTNPEHEVVLEEAAPSGDWGVVAGSFPLDRAAATGTWTVAWRSAGAVDEVPITVEPLRLPRFRVDAVADRPYFRPGRSFAITYRAIATLAGTLHSGASRLEAGAELVHVPPSTWTVE